MDEKDRDEIWDDGLHLTSKGYEMMGEMIAERLIEVSNSLWRNVLVELSQSLSPEGPNVEIQFSM